jgi:hypothetical protein
MTSRFESLRRGITAINSSIEAAEEMLHGMTLSGGEDEVHENGYTLKLVWETGDWAILLEWDMIDPMVINWSKDDLTTGEVTTETFPVGCPPNTTNVRTWLQEIMDMKEDIDEAIHSS